MHIFKADARGKIFKTEVIIKICNDSTSALNICTHPIKHNSKKILQHS